MNRIKPRQGTTVLLLVCIAVLSFIQVPVLPAAAHEDYTVSVFGNANGDDTIDLRDVEYTGSIILGLNNKTPLTDAKNDGKTDVLDMTQTELIMLGKEKELTLFDSAHRVVMVHRPVERVVSLSIDDLRTLTILGAVDRVVARPEYVDKYADKLLPLQAHPEIIDIPSAGGYTDPNLELIISQNPDVIFAYGGSAAYVDVADDIYKKTGIPVVCIKHSIESGYGFDLEALGLVGFIICEQARANDLIVYTDKKTDELSAITSEIPLNEKPRAYFFTAHNANFIERAVPCYKPIDVAGGINVAGEMPVCSVQEISIEQIIEWNPDIILVHSFSKDPAISVETVLSDPSLQSVNAVKNGRVYYTKGFYIGWDPASGVAESFYLAKLFHPERFEYLDVEETGNEIFREFYGADNLYTWMCDSVGNYYRWD